MDYQKVFDAYPQAEKIYVVGSMPFIDQVNAEKWAAEKKVDVHVIPRDGVGPDSTGEEGGEGPDSTGEETGNGPDEAKPAKTKRGKK